MTRSPIPWRTVDSTADVAILMVCTANICRSPLAEALMRMHGDRLGLDVAVDSASVLPETRRLHPEVQAILGQRNIPVTRIESQPLSTELVDQADVILTMTGEHALEVAGRFRTATRKVFMIDHFAQVASRLAQTEPVAQWWPKLASEPRSYPRPVGAVDIVDPMGRPRHVFEAVAGQLDELTATIAAALASD